VVDNEIPHTKWLYEYLYKTLDKIFVVKSMQDNLKYVGTDFIASEITDYVCSPSDLIIHANKPMTNDPGLYLVSLIPEIENVSELVSEIKEDDGSDYPVLECFRSSLQLLYHFLGHL